MGVTSVKPSYLGLLNAIAVAEKAAAEYLACWADTTDDAGTREVVRLVAEREREHAEAFEARIVELGYQVRDKPRDPRPLEIASSRDLTDREKFECLGVGAEIGDGPDVFSGMFADTTIDIETGTLLGRYIAEERDSQRRLHACYQTLCAGSPPGR